MTHVTKRAFSSGWRPLGSLSRTAIAATLLLGGFGLLSGGEAKAFQCTFGGYSLSGVSACSTYTGWNDTNPTATDKELKFVQLPSGSGDIEWYWINDPTAAYGKQWQVDVDFSPDFNNGSIGTSTLEYMLRIKNPVPPGYGTNARFLESLLGANLQPGDTVQKQIFSLVDPYGTPSKGSLLSSVTDPPGAGWNSAISGQLGLYVVDTATAASGAVIDNYQNSYRQVVPGPLPLLGAGMAFGFTRRLRRRVSNARRLCRSAEA